MKILRSAEMREADQRTYACGVSPRAVIESAGRAVFEALVEHYGPTHLERGSIAVFCGSGNNGADGYVTARLLHNAGYHVSVFSVLDGRKLSGDVALERTAFEAICAASSHGDPKVGEIDEKNILEIEQTLRSLSPSIVIDAIYGTGFHGALSPVVCRLADLTKSFRQSGAIVLAVDVPSGIGCDESLDPSQIESAFSADLTVTFQFLKIPHVMLPQSARCGIITVRDVSIVQNSVEISEIRREFVTVETVEGILWKYFSKKNSLHKGDRGHVAVVGGSAGKYGAPVLSGIAALRCGAGLSTLCVEDEGIREALKSYPELMTILANQNAVGTTDEQSFRAQLKKILEKGRSAIVCGPGLGTDSRAVSLVRETFLLVRDQFNVKQTGLVIDADALNLLAKDPTLFQSVPANSVLTPHPGEMARMVGASIEEVERDRLAVATALAQKTQSIVVLKGPRTVIASSNEIWINPAASEVLATAGSGDVLSGVISAFLARGVPPLQAAIAACYVHGEVGQTRCGDVVGLSASMLLDEVPAVINTITAGSSLFNSERNEKSRSSKLPFTIPSVL